MTDTGEPKSSIPRIGNGPDRTVSRRRDAGAVLELCPFLAVDGGAWRSAYAAREHRCQAVQPPAALTVAKQRQLCLTPEHTTCATFGAARSVSAEAIPAGPGDTGAALWPVTASIPLVLEPARRMAALPGASGRGGGQALLVGLMVLAFLVLIIARAQAPAASIGASPEPSLIAGVLGGPSAVPGASPSSASVASSLPSLSPSPGPSPTPALSPSASTTPTPSVAPTARPTATPVAATRRYRVRVGDTLSSIAVRYGTTVKVLSALNNLPDPRLIHVGQVLRIP
ncbi:MAG: LysM domain-containing protein [Candidatus Limnocylindrales bacterium]